MSARKRRRTGVRLMSEGERMRRGRRCRGKRMERSGRGKGKEEREREKKRRVRDEKRRG